MALTAIQRKAAKSLRLSRPAVLEGTNVIPDTRARLGWYSTVTKSMEANRVKDADVGRFCDIAGVPD